MRLIVRRGYPLLVLAVLGLAMTAAHANTTSFSAVIYSYDGPATSAHGGLTSVRLSFVRVAANAAKGGAEVVRIGQAGEDAVRAAYNIGDKVPIRVAGRGRIPDGLTSTTLSEVKNVASLSYTQQLRDFEAYARANNLRFDLYVRGGPNATRLSGPLRAAIQDPTSPIRLRRIP